MTPPSKDENDTNTDRLRSASASHSGQGASSSMWSIGLSRSNLCSQLVQVYS